MALLLFVIHIALGTATAAVFHSSGGTMMGSAIGVVVPLDTIAAAVVALATAGCAVDTKGTGVHHAGGTAAVVQVEVLGGGVGEEVVQVAVAAAAAPVCNMGELVADGGAECTLPSLLRLRLESETGVDVVLPLDHSLPPELRLGFSSSSSCKKRSTWCSSSASDKCPEKNISGAAKPLAVQEVAAGDAVAVVVVVVVPGWDRACTACATDMARCLCAVRVAPRPAAALPGGGDDEPRFKLPSADEFRRLRL